MKIDAGKQEESSGMSDADNSWQRCRALSSQARCSVPVPPAGMWEAVVRRLNSLFQKKGFKRGPVG